MELKLLFTWIGLTLGNIFYVAFTELSWKLVVERSFFQGVALVGAWLVLKITSDKPGK